MIRIAAPLDSLTAQGWLGRWAYGIHGVVRNPYPIGLGQKIRYPYSMQAFGLRPYPLFIYQYYNRLGWCYQRRRTWHGIVYAAISPPISLNQKTNDQVVKQTKFADAITMWQGFDDTLKDIYNHLRYPNRGTGYNKFISKYMKTEPDPSIGSQIQVMHWDNQAGILNGSNSYIPCFGSSYSSTYATSTDITKEEFVAPSAFTIRNMRVWLWQNFGAGNGYKFTLYKNESPTAITVSIVSSDQDKTDTVNTVDVVAGDRLSLYKEKIGAPASPTRGRGSFEFVHPASKRYVLMGSIQNLTTAATILIQPSGLYTATGNEYLQSFLIPHNVTVKGFYVYLQTAPGAGKSRTFDIYKNGGAVADTGFTISDANKSGSISGLSVSLVPGDLLTVRATNANSPATTHVNVGLIMEPEVDGESAVSLSCVTRTTLPYYLPINGTQGTQATETYCQNISNQTIATLKKVCAYFSVAPGAGKSWRIRAKQNLGFTNIDFSVSDTNKFGQDTVNDYTFPAPGMQSRMFNIYHLPVGAVASPLYGMKNAAVLYIPPA